MKSLRRDFLSPQTSIKSKQDVSLKMRARRWEQSLGAMLSTVQRFGQGAQPNQ